MTEQDMLDMMAALDEAHVPEEGRELHITSYVYDKVVEELGEEIDTFYGAKIKVVD